MAEEINLGEKITLKGFQEEEGSTMIVIKKMVGNYVKKIMDESNDLRRVSISLKKVHKHPDGTGKSTGGKNEVHVKLEADKMHTSEVVDHNLFVALDKAFKKVMASL